jgi:formate hydrogenlyase subunit 6/NADH:ubiquinone oxidoreductase subunit I
LCENLCPDFAIEIVESEKVKEGEKKWMTKKLFFGKGMKLRHTEL